MAREYSGTFSGLSTSDIISCGNYASLSLDFEGVAKVIVKRLAADDTFKTIETYTGDAEPVIATIGRPIQLECTEHTNDVHWALTV